ncbi:MAG: kelch motif-containing protein [Chitinophagales bacterium]|nr:kelch motif-containing protein [Chitinophagales bacterium]
MNHNSLLKNNYRKSSDRISFRLTALMFLFFAFCMQQSFAQGTWTKVAAPSPDKNFGNLIMLSDGSALCKSAGGGGSYGKRYNRLTPDSTGSYINGTWSSIASMFGDRLYYSAQLLRDGRLYVAGGEYGSGGSAGEVYDPITDTWTKCGKAGGRISDANSEILPDGKILQAFVTSDLKKIKIYDPATNAYTDAPSTLGIHNESTWTKLPDQSFIQVDRGTTNSERYIPSLGKWVADAIVPVQLYDNLLEIGPAMKSISGTLAGFLKGAIPENMDYKQAMSLMYEERGRK